MPATRTVTFVAPEHRAPDGALCDDAELTATVEMSRDRDERGAFTRYDVIAVAEACPDCGHVFTREEDAAVERRAVEFAVDAEMEHARYGRDDG